MTMLIQEFDLNIGDGGRTVCIEIENEIEIGPRNGTGTGIHAKTSYN